MPRFVLLLCATVFLPTAPIRAQAAADSEVTISADRPAVANSSVVVPVGGFQAGNGFLVTNGQGLSTVDFTETAFRYGLLKKTELRLAVSDYFYDLPPRNGYSLGLW